MKLKRMRKSKDRESARCKRGENLEARTRGLEDDNIIFKLPFYYDTF